MIYLQQKKCKVHPTHSMMLRLPSRLATQHWSQWATHRQGPILSFGCKAPRRCPGLLSHPINLCCWHHHHILWWRPLYPKINAGRGLMLNTKINARRGLMLNTTIDAQQRLVLNRGIDSRRGSMLNWGVNGGMRSMLNRDIKEKRGAILNWDIFGGRVFTLNRGVSMGRGLALNQDLTGRLWNWCSEFTELEMLSLQCHCKSQSCWGKVLHLHC